MKVLVLSSIKKPLMPTTPKRARELLTSGKAAVYRRYPFTLIMKERAEGDTQAVEVKIDPGSKTTGIALVGHFQKQGATVIWAANLTHRGQRIKDALESRASLRRGRRGRKTRYRAPRFMNRRCCDGWLPPSLMSRIFNIEGLLNKLQARCPITSAAMELVKFDMQKMANPEISGVEYQQGELAGYEVREYLLEKWHRKCAYCGAENVPLEIEHIVPRSKGGSNRVSNLTLACRSCNQRKGAQPLEEFLKKNPELVRKIKAQAKAPLKDAAAVNATRWLLWRRLQTRFNTKPTTGSGARTKWNRSRQGYSKDHWIDAACVGESGASITIPERFAIMQIEAKGHGSHKVARKRKKDGSPSKAGRIKRIHGVSTGDIANVEKPSGKGAGNYRGIRIASINAEGGAQIKVGNKMVGISAKTVEVIHHNDGYAYSYTTIAPIAKHCS